MPHDIDQLITALRSAHPDVTIDQRRAADDDVDDDEERWFVNHPVAFTEVQVRTPTGDAPFTIESDLAPPVVVKTVDAAAKLVRARLGLLVKTS